MITLIGIFAVATVSIFIIKYFTGKKKSHSEKSGLEKISGTIINKASRELNDFAEGMRDTETVKKELLKAIDDNTKSLRTQYTQHFESLIRSRETYKKMLDNSSVRVYSIRKKIRELKSEFESTNNQTKKEQAEGLVRILIEAERIQSRSAKNLDVITEKIEKSKNDYQIAVMHLEDRRAEITAIMCNEVISPGYVRDLEIELKEKISNNRIKMESEKLMGETENDELEVSKEEIQQVYDQI